MPHTAFYRKAQARRDPEDAGAGPRSSDLSSVLPTSLLTAPRLKTATRIPLATRVGLRRAARDGNLLLNDLYLLALHRFAQKVRRGHAASWLQPRSVRGDVEGWAQAAFAVPAPLHEEFAALAGHHRLPDGRRVSVASAYLTALTEFALAIGITPAVVSR